MRIFYTINDISSIGQEVIGLANGKFVPTGKEYFERIGKGEIIYDAPVFDYFFLESFDRLRPETWEWKLQDIHGFIEEYPTGGGIFFISDYFKQLLEQFNLAHPYHFYPSKLKYKSQKLDYHLFKLSSDLDKNVLFEKCVFDLEHRINETKHGIYKGSIKNFKEFEEQDEALRRPEKLKLIPKTIVLKYNYDLIALFGTGGGVIISERLKQAIEKAKIEGLEVKPTNYEVIMPEE